MLNESKEHVKGDDNGEGGKDATEEEKYELAWHEKRRGLVRCCCVKKIHIYTEPSYIYTYTHIHSFACFYMCLNVRRHARYTLVHILLSDTVSAVEGHEGVDLFLPLGWRSGRRKDKTGRGKQNINKYRPHSTKKN